ncbi:CASP-like protein 2B1 isoform X2 [Primulina eburnea]|uniref:CASP-like protein 2B1 isoform X2 n=1 Tax=Primulina eburnea TaxID=1245227 RepID=UPI003C6C9D38
MSYVGVGVGVGVGVSPGNVPVYHGCSLKVIDRRVRLAELLLRCLICALAIISIVLIVTDYEVKEIFTIRKEAKFTDMKAVVFLVVTDGLAVAYSLVHVLRCVQSMIRGSVLLNKTLAWAIFSGDQSGIFAKFGQKELQWMKVCKLYEKYCNQSGDGLASALLASLSMVILSAISAFSLFRLYGGNAGKKSGRW